MDAPAFRQPDDAFDINFDLLGVEMDRKPSCGKSTIARILKCGPQFADDLAQRSAAFFFVRTAPQQVDEPVTALMFGIRQGKIAQNGACLLGSDLDQPTVESEREPSHQRDGKAGGSSGSLLRFLPS